MLFLVSRKCEKYDQHDSAVIRAKNATQALKIASEELRPRGAKWDVEIVSQDGPAGVVVGSFNAG